MSKSCQVCGGLIPAANEVLGYSGPICNGMHNQFPLDHNVHIRILELEKRVSELESARNLSPIPITPLTGKKRQ